jgi:eukaryotic-like serine/threonine-protein kinase
MSEDTFELDLPAEDGGGEMPIRLIAAGAAVAVVAVIALLVVLLGTGGGDGDGEAAATPLPSVDRTATPTATQTTSTPSPSYSPSPSPASRPVPPGPTRRPDPVSGTSAVTVPGVTGTSINEARSRLARAGLRSTVSFRCAGLPRGTVLDASPGVGASVPTGTTVALTAVPPATQMIEAPDLGGMTVAQASVVAAQQRLTVAVYDRTTTDDPSLDGQIFDQDPLPHAPVALCSAVRVRVYASVVPPPSPTATFPNP